MTTYPLPTLSVTVDSTGISAPPYSDILASLKASFQSIYGSDVYLEPDSQDGQWLAIMASAINDCNNAAIVVYNAYSPSTAQGAGLSSVVKINGLSRLVASNSSATVECVGQAGTVITNGVISDSIGSYKWSLPSSVVIPVSGVITVTATCQTEGDIEAAPNSLTSILTPTKGWQTVTNPSAATIGAPVEPDSTLRKRQSVSTALPAQSVMDSIIAAVANLTGVQRYKGYENDTDVTDSNGIPNHSIALVVEGGSVTDIANAIATKKTPGTGTYGTTSELVTDSQGVPSRIKFYELTVVPIAVEISITALTGYVSTTGTALVARVAEYITASKIGEDVYYTRLYGPANLDEAALSSTYVVTSIKISRDGNPLTAADIPIAFNEGASCVVADVSLLVT